MSIVRSRPGAITPRAEVGGIVAAFKGLGVGRVDAVWPRA
jgi:hypothetical protein